ncbi:hypothetical protein CCYA_CCYA06G1785 [Cyanidiococcus yangmingshanensis]|nr:hypothetical protein CCYA_CCYA06G1785 [Cyanidiococcus yangmingshanensis]
MVVVPDLKSRMDRVNGRLQSEFRGCHSFRAALLLVVLIFVAVAKVPHGATAVAVPQAPVSMGSAANRGALAHPRPFGSMERPGMRAQHRGTPQNVGYVETNVAERKQLAQSKLVMKELKARTFSVATYQSLGMILVTELGDKTFFIAAVLAARNSRFTVLQGALSALLIMTVLSALLGRTFPKLFSPKYTSVLAGVLFLYFGVQMIRDYWRLCQKRNRAHEQADGEPMNIAETHSEGNLGYENDWQVLEEKLARERERPVRVSGDEAGTVPETDSRTSNASTGANATWLDHIRERLQALETLAQVCFSPLFLRAFTLTFLAEWGDRSQIATIALAAHRNLHGVVLGASFGHLLCTGLAVIGGRLVAHKIPERFIALCGGVLFILFGVLSFCTDHADS